MIVIAPVSVAELVIGNDTVAVIDAVAEHAAAAVLYLSSSTPIAESRRSRIIDVDVDLNLNLNPTVDVVVGIWVAGNDQGIACRVEARRDPDASHLRPLDLIRLVRPGRCGSFTFRFRSMSPSTLDLDQCVTVVISAVQAGHRLLTGPGARRFEVPPMYPVCTSSLIVDGVDQVHPR